MSQLLQDLRYAIRSLGQSRIFSAVAMLTLALGIGANSAIFSVVDAALLRPLPFPEADRLALVWMDNTRMGIRTDITSYPTFLDWRQGSREAFADLAGFSPRRANLSGTDGPPQRIDAPAVMANFFRVLRVEPALGRAFTAEEEQQGKDGVVLLSQGLWQSAFGSDPAIVGQRIRLNGREREVVGVMPPGFDFPEEADVWVPLAIDEQLRSARTAFWLYVVGRLKAGVPVEQAQAALDAVAGRIQREIPDYKGYGVFVQPLREHLVGDVRTALYVLLGAVGFVLLIACANVANLMLARAASREREMAVRSALGAGRGRVIRQLLTESALLSLCGGALGLAVAFWAIRLLRKIAPADLAHLPPLGLDGRVLVFTLAVALATGLLFGLAPALQLSRPRLAEALVERGAGATRRGSLTRRLLVTGEVALALVLLIVAGLLVQSLARLQGVDPGFRAERVVTVSLALSGQDYAEPARVGGFYDALLSRVAALPGVEAVGATSSVLLAELANSGVITVEDKPVPPPAERVEVTFDVVTPGFFRALGTPLLAGRDVAASDAADGAPVALVNQKMARHFWPGEDPLGKRVRLGIGGDSQAPWITVVGVVGDARRTALEQEARPSLFFPHAQFPDGGMTVVARTASDPLRLGREIASAVWALDRNQPVAEISTLEAQLGERLSRRRFNALLLALFSGLALLLAALGVYGVVSYAVAQSRREIGIRMALGARAGDVVRRILAQGMVLVAAGLVVGIVLALAARKALAGLLYGVTASDPATYAALALVLLAVAAAASYLPARRAARTDPVITLRSE